MAKTIAEGKLYEAVDIPDDIVQSCMENLKEESSLEGKALEKQALGEFQKCIFNTANQWNSADATNEWIAANTVDFFNELCLLYGLAEEFHREQYIESGSGFPDGFNYRFPSMDIETGYQYVNQVFAWIEDLIDNPTVFPELDTDQFPEDFLSNHMAQIYKRMIRVYAIIFAKCMPPIEDGGAKSHVVTSFTHFYFFVKRFDLMKDNEKEYAAFENSNTKKFLNMKKLDKQYDEQKAISDKSKKRT